MRSVWIALCGLAVSSALLAHGPLQAAPREKRCVLVFERKDSSYADGARVVFEHDTDSKLVFEATPRDLHRCLEDRFQEIILIAHAFLMQDVASQSASRAKIGYFAPTPDPKIYEKRVFFNQAFVEAERLLELRAQNAAASDPTLKIRVLACAPALLHAEYPALKRILSRSDIGFDFAPVNSFVSFVFNKQDAVTLDLLWLARSIDRWSLKKWRTTKNMRCERDFWPGCDRQKERFVVPIK